MAVFGLIAFLGFDSVGPAELLVLCVVILIVVGPKRLPSAARKAGSVLSNLRRAADEFKNQLMTMDQPPPTPPPAIPSQTTPPIDIPPETGPAAYGRPSTNDADPALMEPESMPAAAPSDSVVAPSVQASASEPRSPGASGPASPRPDADSVTHENPPQKS